jgi:anti-anti-sigma factor
MPNAAPTAAAPGWRRLGPDLWLLAGGPTDWRPGHIALRGDLDVSNTSALDRVLADRLAEGGATVDVDLAELTFIDSAGLRTLASAAGRYEDRHSHLRVHAPRPAVTRMLRIVGLGWLITPEPLPPRSPHRPHDSFGAPVYT